MVKKDLRQRTLTLYKAQKLYSRKDHHKVVFFFTSEKLRVAGVCQCAVGSNMDFRYANTLAEMTACDEKPIQGTLRLSGASLPAPHNASLLLIESQVRI